MTEQEVQELRDLKVLFTACKTEEEAFRAGILVTQDEFEANPPAASRVMVKMRAGGYILMRKTPAGWEVIPK